MRCFLAVSVPDKIKQQISLYQKQLPSKKLKLVPKKQLHLTLFFWPSLNFSARQKVIEATQKITSSFSPFPLLLSGLEGFPKPQKARVLVLKVEGEGIYRLFESLKKELKKANLPLEEREFRPHLTIARFRQPQSLQAFPSFPSLKFTATELIFWRSQLTPNGPIHTPLSSFSLK